MREYGVIHRGFWANEDMRSAGDDARTLAAYLLTSPHTTTLGAFRLPDAYACDDLGWVSERLRNGLETLSRIGFVRYCSTTKWVWVVKFLEWNKPANPNIRKAIAKMALNVPGSVPFREEILASSGVSETVSKPLGNLPSPSPSPSLEGGVGETEAAEVPATGKAKGAITLKTYLADCEAEGVKPIPGDDAVFAYAEQVGLPTEFLAMAWQWFKAKYTAGSGKAKRYIDWRATFRNAVKDCWPKYWAIDQSGAYYLTTQGKQAQREFGNAG